MKVPEEKLYELGNKEFYKILDDVCDYFNYIAEVRNIYNGDTMRFGNITPNISKNVPMEIDLSKIIFEESERLQLKDEMIKTIVNEIQTFNPISTKIAIETFLPEFDGNVIIDFNLRFCYYKPINKTE